MARHLINVVPNYATLGRLTNQLRSLTRIGSAFAQGMVDSGHLIMERSLHIVPMETGNMADGAFVVSEGSGFRIIVTLGYVAPYAIAVHEDGDPPKAHGAEYNAKYATEIAARLRYTVSRVRPDGSTRTYHMRYFARRPQEQANFLRQPTLESLQDIPGLIIHRLRTAIHNAATRP